MQDYKKHLKTIGLKDSSIKNYLWHLDKFLKWKKDNDINEIILKKYFNYLLKKYKRVNTINLRLKIINNYLKFKNNKFRFDLLSEEETNIQILNKEQLEEFLIKPTKNKSLIALRDKALLELLYSSGLKVGQINNLKKEQIDSIKKELLLKRGQSISISPSAYFYLKKYLDKRLDNNEYLFINFDRSNKSEKKYLSVRSIERIINKYSKGINPPININPQILRNTLAYKLKSQGAQSEHIKSALHFQTKSGAKKYLNKI